MTDEFDQSLSFLTDYDEPPVPPKSRRKPRSHYDEFNTGLESITPSAAAKATGSKSMAGQYKRYTVYLSLEDIEFFKQVAAELGLSQAETGRWFFQQMFDFYEDGLRPEMEEVVVRRRLRR